MGLSMTPSSKLVRLWVCSQMIRNGWRSFKKPKSGNVCDHNWEILYEDVTESKKHFKFLSLELSEIQNKNYCVLSIEEILARNGKSLAIYPEISMPDKSLVTNMATCLYIRGNELQHCHSNWITSISLQLSQCSATNHLRQGCHFL
ncbi:hypothetical protein V2J09_016590 [Rumex salicifolius]